MAEVNKETFKSSAPYQVSTDITQPKELKDREKRERQRRREELEENEKPEKKSIGSKIAARFLAIDRDDVKNHLLYDWLFPEIIDMVSNLLSQLFLGNEYSGRMSSSSSRRRKDGHEPYDKKFKGGFGDSGEYGKVLDDDFKHIQISFSNKKKAFEVLDYLRDEIEESDYNNVTVKDLFNHKNIRANTHYKMGEYGWYDLEDNVDIIAKRGDWILSMPPAENLLRRR